MTRVLVAPQLPSDGVTAERARTAQDRGDRDGDARSDHIRVLIADPDGLARRVVSDALREGVSTVVIASVADRAEALELTRHYLPDVLLVDTMLAAGHSVGFVHEAHQASPRTRILTMSADADKAATIAALQAGAIGHVHKDLDPQRLARLVERAAAGEAIVSRCLVTALLDRLREVPETGWRPLHSRLTTREWEVVELLADDASTEEIADRLVLSIETVYSHVKSLLRKLGVGGRREAIVAAGRLRRAEVMGRDITDAELQTSPYGLGF